MYLHGSEGTVSQNFIRQYCELSDISMSLTKINTNKSMYNININNYLYAIYILFAVATT